MAIFLLIRHGENDYVKEGRLAGRLPGVHLNERGRAQAQALAEKLKDAPIKAIYSSPLERAMETAAPLAEALGQEIIQRPGLLETHIGDWQDKKLRGLFRLRVWRKVQLMPSLVQFPGGETFFECQLRIVQELEQIRSMHDAKDLVACVFHSDPIKLAVAYYLGMPLDLFQRIHISTGSFTVLSIGDFGGRLETINYDPTLSFNKQEHGKG